MRLKGKNKKIVKDRKENRKYKINIKNRCMLFVKTNRSIPNGKFKGKVVVNPKPGGGTIPQDEK